MTIKVYSDRIEIGAKVITTTPTGIRIDDSLAANTQAQGYVRQANFTARELAYGNFAFQGSVAGFSSGGYAPTAQVNTIDKFPFSTDTNASDVGDLSQVRWGPSGQSSPLSGYTSGGDATGPTGFSNTIDKFTFANKGNATDVGDLTNANRKLTGQSSSVSGYSTSMVFSPPNVRDAINKFPFASDSNATNIGILTADGYGRAGQSSTVSGYSSGGSSPFLNTIDKFPFSA